MNATQGPASPLPEGRADGPEVVEFSTACTNGDHWACFIGCMCTCHAPVVAVPEGRADGRTAGVLAIFRALFNGGPDTACATSWREHPGFEGETWREECCEVPMDALRQAFHDAEIAASPADVAAPVVAVPEAEERSC